LDAGLLAEARAKPSFEMREPTQGVQPGTVFDLKTQNALAGRTAEGRRQDAAARTWQPTHLELVDSNEGREASWSAPPSAFAARHSAASARRRLALSAGMMGSCTPVCGDSFKNPKQRIGRSFVAPAAISVDETKKPLPVLPEGA
jgi:hypothetical protein